MSERVLSENIAGLNPEAKTFVGRKSERFKHLRSLVGKIGAANAAWVAFDERKQNDPGERKIVVSGRGGIRFPISMTIDGSDITTYDEIANQEVYKLSSDLESQIDGQPIVDIGAHIGISTAYFASHFPNSPILAIEPRLRNYELLEDNVAPYGDQIATFRAALVAKSGSLGVKDREPAIPNFVSYSYTAEQATLVNGEEAPVPITPPGLMFKYRIGEIGLLKVDIEGAERELFNSAGIGVLLSRVNNMLVESHDRYVHGSSYAVDQAADKNGLTKQALNSHTTFYTRT